MDDNHIKANVPSAQDVLDFQIDRAVTSLFRQFLTLLEDLENDHDINFDKLRESLASYEKLINQADYLGDAKKDYLRKKVLDLGNDCKRQIRTHLDCFHIEY